MNKIELSLVFCCYNVAQYLNEVFSWVDKNIKQNIEVIFIEDKSTDNETKELLENYISRNREYNLSLILNQKNQGLSQSRNIGISNSKGRYIGFPDPDDLFDDRWINELLEIINNDAPDVIITGMREDYEIDHIEKYSKLVLCRSENGLICKDKFYDSLLELEEVQLFGYMNNKVYKSSIIRDNNILCRKLALKEDFDFNIQFFNLIDSFYILNKPYYFYKKRNNSSLTTKFVPDYWDIHKNSVVMFKELLERDKSLSIEEKTLLVNRFFRFFISAIERNANREANMSFKQQKDWILSVLSDKEIDFYLNNLNFLSGKFKYLNPILRGKSASSLVLLGNMIKVLKKNFPILFSKIKG